ncbi:ABC transporter ATP-binding protein [Micromonospora zhanjiangensis]
MDFAAGTFTAVMGPSGSGKSTLLHCAAGLDRPTAGTVSIGGTDLGGLDDTGLTLLRRDRVGFVFQAFNLVSALTAAQNIGLPERLAGRRPDPDRVAAALAAVGLTGRGGHRPGELSGGEQQRVAIARALNLCRSPGAGRRPSRVTAALARRAVRVDDASSVTGPAVLFADEPTGALDTRTSRQVLELLRSTVDERGQTVVMVTHDPVAATYADRVLLLADGRVADDLGGGLTAESVAARMTRLEATC